MVKPHSLIYLDLNVKTNPAHHLARHPLARPSQSSSSSSSSTVDAGKMPLCPHLLQLVIITYRYYLLHITLRIGLQFQRK